MSDVHIETAHWTVVFAPHPLDAELGRAARIYAGLELTIRDLSWALSGLPTLAAKKQTDHLNLGKLVNRCRSWVPERNIPEPCASELADLLDRAYEATKKRNTLLHSVVGFRRQVGTHSLISLGREPHPDLAGDITANDIARLADEAHTISMDLISFRRSFPADIDILRP